MQFDFDYDAARRAGYSDDDILNGLQKQGKLDFDLNAARKAGYSGSDILSSLLSQSRQPAEVKQESSGILRRAGDIGISALKGVIGVPETIVGLADIATGGAAGRGAEALGFRPAEAKQTLNELYSPEQQAANRRVSDAKGFVDTAGAMVQNPSTILQTAVESGPSMLAGGAVARGLGAVTKIAPYLAGAAGEGIVGAGQAAEQIRQQSPDKSLSLGQSAAALASGIGTGLFGAIGGRIAQRLGVTDIDTVLAGAGANVTSKGVARRLIEGGLTEGILEELPQSAQEQIWQNAALDKPLLEGVPEQAAQGLLVGGAFGGVAGAALHGRTPQQQPEAAPLLLENRPDPYISFPDGSVGKQSEVDAFLAALPEADRNAARARLYGMEPQPYTAEDVLQTQSANEAIVVANRAIEEATPFEREKKAQEIDAAWQAYRNNITAQRDQDFVAALQARREADIPAMQTQQQDQAVEQANALTRSQGFDEQQPTAMELAYQQAQALRQSRLAEVRQNATLQDQSQGGENGQGNLGIGLGDVNSLAGRAGIGNENGSIRNEGLRQDSGIREDAAANERALDGGSRAQREGENGLPSAQGNGSQTAVIEKAKSVLDAAGVTGNERMAALRAIRSGENTIEDLIDAHPPKEQRNDAAPAANTVPVSNERTAGAATSTQEQPTTAPALQATSQPAAQQSADTASTGLAGGTGVSDANSTSGKSAALKEISGRNIDKHWTEFSPKSGTLNIDRAQMPQVKAEHRGAMVNYLNARGITHESEEVPASSLKATQREYSPEKVQKALDYQGGDRSILISSDNHVLDGHHQWLAKLEKNEPVKVIRLNAPIRELLEQVKDFPSSTVAEGATLQDVRKQNERPFARKESTGARADFASVERQQSKLEAEIEKARNNAAQRAANKEQKNGSTALNEQQGTTEERGNGNQSREETRTGRSDSVQRTARSEEKPVEKGKVVERYLGQYGKGMSGANARAEVAKRNAKNDGTTWRAEVNEDLGYDRYEVVGYRDAKPRKSEAPARGGMRAEDVNRSLTMLRAKWLGSNKINTVQSIADLPADVRERSQADDKTEGLYDPKTGQVYLVADNISDPARGAWTAAHEIIGHGGLRALKDKTVNEALNVAGANKFVKELAEAIGKDRATDKESLTVEEAVAELAAAIETGDFKALEQRYGVDVPASARNGVRATIARVIDAIKRFLASAIGKPVSSVSDADVRALIGAQREAVSQQQVTPTGEDEAPLQSRTPVAGGEEVMPKWAESLTPEVQAALRKSGAIYTEKTMRQKITELKDGVLKKMQYGILDQFAPIKDQIGKIPYILARMAKNADGTLEAMMLYGRPHLDQDGGMLVDTTKKGFIETMQALDGEHDRFFSWLAGRRAEQLKKEGRENLFTDSDISALSTLNQGKMKDGSSRETAYLKAQKDVAELNNSVLDIAEKSGLIDGASRKVWQSDFYVPFYRVMQEGVTGPSIKSGLINQKSINKLKGGTNNLGDLTQNMLMNWSTLLTASAKNRAAKATLDGATALGAAIEADEATIRQMAKSAQSKAVSYMEDGKYRWFTVEDEHLLAAVSALDFSGYNNQAMKVMGAFKNYLTMAVTASPLFKVRNLIRDSISSIAVSEAGYNPLVNLKNGFSLLRDKEFRAQMVASGGVYRFGTFMEGNRGDYVKKLIDAGVDDNTILDTAGKMRAFTQKLWDSYQNIGDLGENVNRAALYEKLRKEGKSHLEASFESRDLMDFGLSGAWAGVRALNQILPFFNARLQGLYKLGRGYNDDPKRMGTVIGAVALASVALMLAYKDDDDFKKRTDADRNNYWWFKVGDVAYRIPKPFEIGSAGSAIEHLTALMVDSENTNAKRFVNQLGDIVNAQLAMNPIPQVFRPVIDVYANKDAFTGRPIENMAMQRLRPEDRYTYNTSELARLLSKSGMLVDPVSLVSGTGVKQLSPVQIDSMIRGYFSGVGTLATAAVDGLLHHTVIDRGEALPLTVKSFTGSFAETLPTNSSRYVDMLYSTAQDIEQTYASYQNAIKNGDLEKARSIADDKRDEIAKYHMVESLKKNETKINQLIQRTLNSKELTGEQKEATIKRLKKSQDEIARQFAKRQ